MAAVFVEDGVGVTKASFLDANVVRQCEILENILQDESREHIQVLDGEEINFVRRLRLDTQRHYLERILSLAQQRLDGGQFTYGEERALRNLVRVVGGRFAAHDRGRVTLMASRRARDEAASVAEHNRAELRKLQDLVSKIQRPLIKQKVGSFWSSTQDMYQEKLDDISLAMNQIIDYVKARYTDKNLRVDVGDGATPPLDLTSEDFIQEGSRPCLENGRSLGEVFNQPLVSRFCDCFFSRSADHRYSPADSAAPASSERSALLGGC